MGVNLLPFIDRDRLIKAMNQADQNGELLTKNEQERNQLTGNIYLFFNQKDIKNPKINSQVSTIKKLFFFES